MNKKQSVVFSSNLYGHKTDR